MHRDFKPENIFLQIQGMVQLGDFGLSVQLTREREKLDRKGTQYYVPPEFWGHNNLTGYEHDVWAIGVILFEMLTGRKPFVGANAQETAEKIITSGYDCDFPHHASKDLIYLINFMMTKKKSARPTIEDVL